MNYIAQSLVTIDNKSAYLKWDPVQDRDLAGYNIYMAVGTPTNWKKMNSSVFERPEYMSSPLRRDLIYYFRVTSVDLTGNESQPSGDIEFKFSDYKADPNLRIVKRPYKLKLPAAIRTSVEVPYEDFMTIFTWVDAYLTQRVDVDVPSNSLKLLDITHRDFLTQFTLGG